MSGVGLIGAVVVGVLAGWIAERAAARHHGLLTNLVVGFVGALIGAFLADVLAITWGGAIGSLAMSAVGAAVLLILFRLARRP